MFIMAIDPGTFESAYVIYWVDRKCLLDMGHCKNDELLKKLSSFSEPSLDRIICEGIQSYGMPVGKETFETCYWIGRFWQACNSPFEIYYRRDVKLTLCGSARAKDGNVRQAILDLFPATGGGKTPQIGTKGQPGPLYGVSNHIWSALAIAVAWAQQKAEAIQK